MFNEQSKAISVSFEITEMRPKMLLRADSTTAAIAHCSNGLVEFDQDNCSERTFRVSTYNKRTKKKKIIISVLFLDNEGCFNLSPLSFSNK